MPVSTIITSLSVVAPPSSSSTGGGFEVAGSGAVDSGIVGLEASGWIEAVTTLAIAFAAAWGSGSFTEQEASPASGFTHHWARGRSECLDFI